MSHDFSVFRVPWDDSSIRLPRPEASLSICLELCELLTDPLAKVQRSKQLNN
jgi:hypothetical protein